VEATATAAGAAAAAAAAVPSLPSASSLLAALSVVETRELYFVAGGAAAPRRAPCLAPPARPPQPRARLSASQSRTTPLRLGRPCHSRLPLSLTPARRLVAGLCASISHALATPIDVVKTRQQTVADYRDLSLLEGLRRVAATDGPKALFTGIAPTVVGCAPLSNLQPSNPSTAIEEPPSAVGSSPRCEASLRHSAAHTLPPRRGADGAEGALKFGAYEALKPSAAAQLSALGLGAEQSASLGPIAAAVVAGGLASLVLAPAEATRIRMVRRCRSNHITHTHPMRHAHAHAHTPRPPCASRVSPASSTQM